MRKELADIIAAGYAANVMGQGDISIALAQFNQRRGDQGFMDEARSELERLRAVNPKRCFLSKVQADFLDEAILAAEATPLPAPPTFTTTKEEDMTSKLKGLADLAKSVTSEVESRAGASIDRLTKAQERAHGGLDKLDGVAAEIEKSASDIEDFTNQVTNGPPA